MYPEIDLDHEVVVVPEITTDSITVIRVIEEPGTRLLVQCKVADQFKEVIVFGEEDFDPNWTDQTIIDAIKSAFTTN